MSTRWGGGGMHTRKRVQAGRLAGGYAGRGPCSRRGPGSGLPGEVIHLNVGGKR